MDTMWTGQCAWSSSAAEAEGELRRGPWTVEEDAVLAGHVVAHGEGRWNELARAAGLRRTGKSCRLRWLNYLRPGVRRGDFTPQEQLLILELHLRWGNRWSRIAQHMPGRTDNEIKNYWRTRVQKHAKQLNCDVNSSQFHDVMRRLWMPRLVERIHAAAAAAAPPMTSSGYDAPPSNQLVGRSDSCHSRDTTTTSSTAGSSSTASVLLGEPQFTSMTNQLVTASSDGGVTDWSSSKQCGSGSWSAGGSVDLLDGSWSELLARSYGDDGADSLMLSGTADLELGESGDNWWSLEDIWLHQQY